LNFTTPQNKARSSASSQLELIASLINGKGISSSLSFPVYLNITSVKNSLKKSMNFSFSLFFEKQLPNEI